MPKYSLTCDQFVKQDLSEYSLFAQLVYLSCRCYRDSGWYEHRPAEQLYGAHKTNQVLRALHKEVFRNWLSLTLEQQTACLALYLRDDPSNAAGVPRWLEEKRYGNMVPSNAPGRERELFLTDMEIGVTLLLNSHSHATPVPGASFSDLIANRRSALYKRLVWRPSVRAAINAI